VEVNDEMGHYFQTKKGLRQGDAGECPFQLGCTHVMRASVAWPVVAGIKQPCSVFTADRIVEVDFVSICIYTTDETDHLKI
jgi:hypothetical protein